MKGRTMRKSDSIENISVALSALQSEVKDTFKGKKGYGYNYATLDAILKDNRPLLAKHGLAFTQSEEFNEAGTMQIVKGLLTHSSGEWIETTSMAPFQQLKGMNYFQSAGAGFTYLRRYNLSAAIGISSDDDIDAQGEAAKKQPTLSSYLKQHGVSAKAFVSHFMIQQSQAKDLLNNTAQLDKMIEDFKKATMQKAS